MADAEVAAALLARIQADLCAQFDLPDAKHALLMKVQACQRHAVAGVVQRHLSSIWAASEQDLTVKYAIGPRLL